MNPAVLSLLGFAAGGAAPDVIPDVVTAGGRGDGAKRRAFVEFNGQRYPVSSPEQARKVLAELKVIADQKVGKVVRKAVAKNVEAPKVSPPQIEVEVAGFDAAMAHQIYAQVDAANARLVAQYQAAIVAAQEWQRRRAHELLVAQEMDEEEALAALGII